MDRRNFVETFLGIIPVVFARASNGVVDFKVWNQSSYVKTFHFIDEANNNQATYQNMQPDEKRDLRLACKPGSEYGWMKYNSNQQPKWTEVGWIKDGEVVTLY